MFSDSIINQQRVLIEAYNSGNSWYNLYSDGWCEQGGFNSSSGGFFNYLIPLKDGALSIQAMVLNTRAASGCAWVDSYDTGVKIFAQGNYGIKWCVKGYARDMI